MFGAMLVAGSPASAQQFITEPEGSVSIARGTSAVLVSPVDLNRVSMADPEVAEAVVMSPTEVLINGRGLGTTTFVVWDTAGVRRIYGVEVTPEDEVSITMTLTSPMCPVAESLPIEVEAKVRTVEGVRDVVLDLVWDPPWSPDLMSDAAKLELNFY